MEVKYEFYINSTSKGSIKKIREYFPDAEMESDGTFWINCYSRKEFTDNCIHAEINFPKLNYGEGSNDGSSNARLHELIRLIIKRRNLCQQSK